MNKAGDTYPHCTSLRTVDDIRSYNRDGQERALQRKFIRYK